jgi:hypothetical protein
MLNQINTSSATEALLNGARNVSETSGGYTYVVVVQSSIIVILLFTVGYLYVTKRKDDKENELYLREISKEAITSVIKTETVLENIEKKLNLNSREHEAIKDNLSQIKGKM